MIIPYSDESSRLAHPLRDRFGIFLRFVSEINAGESRALPAPALSHGGRQVMQSSNYRVAHL